ncbi:MAG: PIN domain protein [Rhodoferax sp.]|nr:PIN domain protein [Rhodoferax sp.]
MLIYLDLCCFNRPYDDQSQLRVRLETEAKLSLQDKVRSGVCQLVWSAVLDLENSKNPYVEHMQAISQWRALASNHVMAGPEVMAIAAPLVTSGVHTFDALHVASVVVGNAELFITTDDRLLKRVRHLQDIKVLFPADALAFLENWYEH